MLEPEQRHTLANLAASILVNVEYALLLLEPEKRDDDVKRALENARTSTKELAAKVKTLM